MATQISEQDLVLETKQTVVQRVDLRQEVKETSLCTPTVQVPSGDQNACRAMPDPRDGLLISYSIRKALARFARQLAVVYDMLVAPAATERGRIRNAMVKAKHDRYISFLR